MTEIYHWEDDDDVEDVTSILDERGIEYETILLDPEIPNARTSIHHQGLSYWSIPDFLKFLENEENQES